VEKGPLVATIDAGADVFRFYTGGIIHPSECDTDLNHAVQLVGYNETYWILRNSWGITWGEEGYFRLERTTSSEEEAQDTDGTCGVALGIWGLS
jgi:KDEL-tailed cysteine endopeptidase